MALGNKYKEIKQNRVGETNYNKQGSLMKIIEYNTNKKIIVEFQDKYHARVNTRYAFFIDGSVRNPYDKSVYGFGIVGNKYSSHTKEYQAWHNILTRCFDNIYKEKYPTYQNAVCCEEWALYENFYEWLHEQENFDKWLNNNGWNIDKDIIIKGNKVYSPETCCLVPNNINKLLTKNDAKRGHLPIGVTIDDGQYCASCNNPFTKKTKFLGYYSSSKYAFLAYKKYKENWIKEIAKEEYSKGNITEKCFNALINYEVEIDD